MLYPYTTSNLVSFVTFLPWMFGNCLNEKWQVAEAHDHCDNLDSINFLLDGFLITDSRIYLFHLN